MNKTDKEIYISPEKRKQIINEDQYHDIVMEYQKIRNLLDNTSNQSSKFRTKKWIEIIDESRGRYNGNSQIKFNTAC